MRRIANTGDESGTAEAADPAVALLAERQFGVVSRRQLHDLGLTDDMIDNRARTGRLHRIIRETYAVRHRGIGRNGRMLAAVLVCGEGAVVSHGSAAELLGLWNKKPVLINVIGPSQAGRKIDGVRWHRVSLPGPDEMTIQQGIPCTSVSRTLVDLAGSLGQISLRRVVEQAAVLRLLDIPDVDRILARGRRRGASQLREVLVAWRGEKCLPHLRSLLEARLFPALVEADLPRPRCNVKLQIAGRYFEVDLLWEEQRLVIETDGEETHGTRAAFRRDRWRDQVLTAAGYRTARITWIQMDEEPAAVVARIKRMLEVAQRFPVFASHIYGG
jgi:very-short-patch-repair endonuclease